MLLVQHHFCSIHEIIADFVMPTLKSIVLAFAAAASAAASLDSKSHAGSDVLTVGVLGGIVIIPN